MAQNDSPANSAATELRDLAERRYGVERARDLSEQIAALGANVDRVRGYRLAPEAEPWTGVPLVTPVQGSARV